MFSRDKLIEYAKEAISLEAALNKNSESYNNDTFEYLVENEECLKSLIYKDWIERIGNETFANFTLFKVIALNESQTNALQHLISTLDTPDPDDYIDYDLELESSILAVLGWLF